MTIYAIANDLQDCKSPLNADHPVWTLISPAAILQGGNPFFVPDFANRFEARVALAVRIGKLGKGIARRFAYRYVDAVAPALLFVAADRLKSLSDEGLPWTSAISYDRSLALGKFADFDLEKDCNCEIDFTLDAGESSTGEKWKPESLKSDIEGTVNALSRDNTLKMGDIILMGLGSRGPEVRPDMRAHLSLNGAESLVFNIR